MNESFWHKKNNLIHYLILLVGFTLILLLFYMFRYSYEAKVLTSFASSLFYFLWGVTHHKIHERLSKNIVFEYASFGFLVFVILLVAVNL